MTGTKPVPSFVFHRAPAGTSLENAREEPNASENVVLISILFPLGDHELSFQ